jgi:nucleoid-associated protein
MRATIHNVIVHRLIKEQHQPIQPSQMRDAVLDRGNEHVQKLIDSLVAIYGTHY